MLYRLHTNQASRKLLAAYQLEQYISFFSLAKFLVLIIYAVYKTKYVVQEIEMVGVVLFNPNQNVTMIKL